MVNIRVKSVEDYLYEISAVIKGVDMPMYIINESKHHAELSVRNSTKFHFAENFFY